MEMTGSRAAGNDQGDPDDSTQSLQLQPSQGAPRGGARRRRGMFLMVFMVSLIVIVTCIIVIVTCIVLMATILPHYATSNNQPGAREWIEAVNTTRISSGVKDYCLKDILDASCKPGQIIVFDSALFGRMRQTRCITDSYGLMGCATNVLNLADSQCSGRPRCSFSIADPNLGIIDTNPCPKGISSYLQAEYSCVNVATCEHSQCESSTFLHLRSPNGYLASWVTDTEGCGSASCPWVIEAQPGQRINITLFDFSIATRNTNSMGNVQQPGNSMNCDQYAIIKETDLPRSPICRSDHREGTAYISQSHKVEITMISRTTGLNKEHFMLQYEAVGSP